MVFRLPSHIGPIPPPANQHPESGPWRGSIVATGVCPQERISNQEILVTAVGTDGGNRMQHWPKQFIASITVGRPILRDVQVWVQQYTLAYDLLEQNGIRHKHLKYFELDQMVEHMNTLLVLIRTRKRLFNRPSQGDIGDPEIDNGDPEGEDQVYTSTYTEPSARQSASTSQRTEDGHTPGPSVYANGVLAGASNFTIRNSHFTDITYNGPPQAVSESATVKMASLSAIAAASVTANIALYRELRREQSILKGKSKVEILSETPTDCSIGKPDQYAYTTLSGVVNMLSGSQSQSCLQINGTSGTTQRFSGGFAHLDSHLPTLATSAITHVSSHQAEEDFINKSLLDSLDAQAGAEPISSYSDSEQPTVATSYGSAFGSSFGSPSVPYHIPMNNHLHHLPRPDSPPGTPNQQNIHHHIHSQDPLYSTHDLQYSLHFDPFSNSAMHIQSDYSTDFDSQKSQQQQQHKLNGSRGNNYRASFSSFPNTTRTRYQTPQSILGSGAYRDQLSLFLSSANPYSQRLTSPIQAHMQPYDSRASYDLGPSQRGLGSGTYGKPFLGDTCEALLGMFPQSHLNPAKEVVHQQHPQGGYSGYTNDMMMQLSAHTPYNPYMPSSVTASVGNPMGGGPAPSTGVSAAGGSSGQEEISTIFVVGFPDDMQEREFQNMFTFSPGFEAAVLKIPNKEYTAYDSVVGSARGHQQYAGSNDPYDLVIINQGGVVVDGGRDRTLFSWPAVNDGSAGGPYMGGLGGSAAPRKQIIGFAKFRSREAALDARDMLHSRRVDIEKGAVLKAEMAKKNLHTKRGVGPVQVSSRPSANGAVGVGGDLPGVLGNPSALGDLQQGMVGSMEGGGEPSGLGSGVGENQGLSMNQGLLGGARNFRIDNSHFTDITYSGPMDAVSAGTAAKVASLSAIAAASVTANVALYRELRREQSILEGTSKAKIPNVTPTDYSIGDPGRFMLDQSAYTTLSGVVDMLSGGESQSCSQINGTSGTMQHFLGGFAHLDIESFGDVPQVASTFSLLICITNAKFKFRKTRQMAQASSVVL